MSAWSEGYVSDINYTYGYYGELNPQQMAVPLLMAGIAPPPVGHACELGFGQGISAAMHAAGGQAVWHATDFNPSHTAFARNLETRSGSGRLNAFDQSFGEFCQRPDLPDFDYIGLHGIWSWISDDNRRIIVDFVRRKLKPGGVLYISYNTLPGWSAAAPLRHLLAQTEQVLANANHHRHDNIRTALEETGKVLGLSRLLTQNAPNLAARCQQLSSQNLNYVAHEYLNQNWQPMYFSEMADHLEAAKMNYACSANYLNDFADCLFDAEQKNLLQTINSPLLTQTVKDYLLNTQFRADFWVKGARAIGRSEKARLWDALTVMLVGKREKIELAVEKYYKVQLLPELFNPVLDLLSDHRPHTVGELRQALPEFGEDTLYAVLAVLSGKHHIVLVQQPDASRRNAAHALNRYILEETQFAQDIAYLCSPLTGGGIHCGRIDMLFLLALLHGIRQEDWIDFVWKQLQKHKQVLKHQEQLLETEAENLQELSRLKEEFLNDQWPVLQALDLLPLPPQP